MSSDNEPHRTWREKISHLFNREPKDREELMEVLQDANSRKLFDNEALSMMEGVLDVSETQARDSMVPRTKMVLIEEQMSFKDALPIIINSSHSRYPVIDGNHEKIIGILHAKDLLRFILPDKKGHLSIKDIIRPAIFIPESKRLDSLLKEFQQKHNHMAIVIDEYGNIAGLITIEDVLEEIVGDIEDEFDKQEEPDIKSLGDNCYLIKALTTIEDINTFFNVELPDEACDTFGGLIVKEFCHLPKQGETIELAPFNVKVVEANSRGIQLLKVTINEGG